MADTHVRLLLCHTEKTIEEIPDYEGPSERDFTLQHVLQGHRFPSGEDHIGVMGRVEAKHWSNPTTRAAILAQIKESADYTGLDPSFYDVKNTLQEDAMTCWTRDHNRVKACPDYKTDAKRLMPDTSKERKEAGVGKFRSTVFLCDYCPVHSLVQQAAFDRSGARN